MSVSGRVLALDVGTKTIGLAVSDPTRRMVFPLRTLARRSVVKDTEEIARVCLSQGITQLVVGLPLTLDGGEARSAHLARQVGEAVAARTGLPHAFIDERFSTVEAERRLREAGAPADRRKAVIDQYAAVVILEDWITAVNATSAGG